MKKNIFYIIYVSLLLLVLFFILIYSSDIISVILYAIKIWKNNLFTSLFPIFIISDLLINYNFIKFIGKILKKPLYYIFNLDEYSIFVFIMSIFTGCPGNAKYIKELLKKDLITINMANRLLAFTHFSNPLFVIGFVGSILEDKIYSIYILISMFISNLIICVFTKNKTNLNKNYNNDSLYNYDKKNFFEILSNAIYNSINTLLLLLGIIIIFFIITTIITNIFDFNIFSKTIVSGLLEITQGISFVSFLDISTYLKIIIITFFLSFGGLSIHIQVMSILNEFDIKYKNYLLYRILHSIISSIISFILVYFFT